MKTQTIMALARITEENFMGRKLWTHARKGDLGEVIHIDEEGNPTVRFFRSGTATVVAPSEYQTVAMA
jgi:hypothetical protein